ncbi:hypothetical protein CLU79DRAFT_39263 [Phycomyces nitens]|nr:hypothetical protein CLU79DRAFT_39263 [Phycomyces nitens]
MDQRTDNPQGQKPTVFERLGRVQPIDNDDRTWRPTANNMRHPLPDRSSDRPPYMSISTSDDRRYINPRDQRNNQRDQYAGRAPARRQEDDRRPMVRPSNHSTRPTNDSRVEDSRRDYGRPAQIHNPHDHHYNQQQQQHPQQIQHPPHRSRQPSPGPGYRRQEMPYPINRQQFHTNSHLAQKPRIQSQRDERRVHVDGGRERRSSSCEAGAAVSVESSTVVINENDDDRRPRRDDQRMRIDEQQSAAKRERRNQEEAKAKAVAEAAEAAAVAETRAAAAAKAATEAAAAKEAAEAAAKEATKKAAREASELATRERNERLRKEETTARDRQRSGELARSKAETESASKRPRERVGSRKVSEEDAPKSHRLLERESSKARVKEREPFKSRDRERERERDRERERERERGRNRDAAKEKETADVSIANRDKESAKSKEAAVWKHERDRKVRELEDKKSEDRRREEAAVKARDEEAARVRQEKASYPINRMDEENDEAHAIMPPDWGRESEDEDVEELCEKEIDIEDRDDIVEDVIPTAPERSPVPNSVERKKDSNSFVLTAPQAPSTAATVKPSNGSSLKGDGNNKDQQDDLPHPWRQVLSSKREIYYYNTKTEECVWDRPTAENCSRPLETDNHDNDNDRQSRDDYRSRRPSTDLIPHPTGRSTSSSENSNRDSSKRRCHDLAGPSHPRDKEAYYMSKTSSTVISGSIIAHTSNDLASYGRYSRTARHEPSLFHSRQENRRYQDRFPLPDSAAQRRSRFPSPRRPIQAPAYGNRYREQFDDSYHRRDRQPGLDNRPMMRPPRHDPPTQPQSAWTRNSQDSSRNMRRDDGYMRQEPVLTERTRIRDHRTQPIRRDYH